MSAPFRGTPPQTIWRPSDTLPLAGLRASLEAKWKGNGAVAAPLHGTLYGTLPGTLPTAHCSCIAS